MDPISALGAAASIIAVIQMTQSVGLLLRDLYKNTRDARADIERLYESIVSLEIIVKGLDDLAKESPLTHSALFENLKGPLQTIFTELEGLKEKLEVQADGKYERVKLSMRKEVKRSLKWSFQKDEIVATAARLENLKSSLTLETGVNILLVPLSHLKFGFLLTESGLCSSSSLIFWVISRKTLRLRKIVGGSKSLTG